MVEPRPTGMRILRPYKTEEDFIRGDGLTIGRMGMILPGAPERPPGIIIRFEIVLADGQPVFRGEGKVVAHRVHANGRKGLEVKFTRLDAHSKGVVDRALELRRTGALTPGGSSSVVPDLTPLPVSVPPVLPAVELRNSVEPSGPSVRPSTGKSVEVQREPAAPPAPASTRAPARSERPVANQAPEQRPQHEPAHQRTALKNALAPDLAPRIHEASDEAAQQDAAAAELAEQTELLGTVVQEPAVLEVSLPRVQVRQQAAVQEPEPEPSEAAVDDAPTPFAPPVIFDTAEVAAVAATPSAPPSPAPVRLELEKLRSRQTRVEAPEAREALLERLRSRRKGA